MADPIHKPFLDRMAALTVAPFLLGRQALSLGWIRVGGEPPEPQAEPPARIAITSPEHAIKRRG